METNESGVPSSSEAAKGAELSDREHEILRLVATGASNKQIAQQLVISPNTVKVHLRNIFAKLGVGTRTEATLYAIRQGLVQVPASSPVNFQESEVVPAAEPAVPNLTPIVPTQQRSRSWSWLAVFLVIVAVLIATAIIVRQRDSTFASAKATAAAVVPRWQTATNMPSAISSLAAASYELKVYTVGGATTDGVIGLTQSFDSVNNSWIQLAPKPIPVAEIQAAIVGGLIFVPGGRTATGQVTNVLEVYNPRTDRWEQRAPMPQALSAYAMVAFEGQLYVFGGWDGQHFVDSVYTYNPTIDKWSESFKMPEARAFAGAAVASGAIYVIGGENGSGPLANNEQYAPEKDAAGQNPWLERAALPGKQSGIGVTSIADIVYAIGGEGQPGFIGAWEYFPQTDTWQALDAPMVAPTVRLAVTPIETHLFMAGGLQAKSPSNQFLAYQAIYSTIFPVIGGP